MASPSIHVCTIDKFERRILWLIEATAVRPWVLGLCIITIIDQAVERDSRLYKARLISSFSIPHGCKFKGLSFWTYVSSPWPIEKREKQLNVPLLALVIQTRNDRNPVACLSLLSVCDNQTHKLQSAMSNPCVCACSINRVTEYDST